MSRKALITGGGEGIGKATCQRLAELGFEVGVLGRTASNLRETAAEIENSGGKAQAIEADITDFPAMEEAMGSFAGSPETIDFLFVNAGINGVWAPIDKLQVEEWRQTIDINLTGSFITIKTAYPYLRKSEHPSVAITSSVNGTRIFSNSGATAYSSSKAAQAAMGKMLALELASERIRVNTICPGAIESSIGENTTQRDVEEAREPVEFPEGQIPLTDGKPGKASDVADLVAFLASEKSRHITGATIFIDGAQSLLRG